MYKIEFSEAERMFRLRLHGFWTLQTMDAFEATLVKATRAPSVVGTGFVVLSDCRDYPVQSTEIMAAWSRALGLKPVVAAPYAIVVGSVLNKLQPERGLTAPNVGVFTSIAAAEAWLSDNRKES